MYITELEIDNFKSFVKKTKIPFYQGFTVISGPNGSGKSNIVDSILFVLGLSSSRTLRAERLTDLINLNSGRNTAEVSILFSDGTRVRRRIKRTSSGYYSYHYLNDRLCKQTDVLDLLARQGIIPHGYNVVLQGDITRIIEMSDTERRKIIDEIAGVAEFDAKRDQALAELEVVRERIEREEMLLHELNIRLESLKHEREQALKYKKRQDELEYLQACRRVAQLHDQERECTTVTRLMGEQEIVLGRILADRDLEENEHAYHTADLKDIDDQIGTKSGSEYLKLIADLEEAKSGIKLSEKTIERLIRDKEANLEDLNRSYLDQKRAETRVGECTESIRTHSIDRANLAMEGASLRAQIGNMESDIQQQSRDAADSKDKLFSLLQKVEEKKGARTAILHEQDMLLEKSRMRTGERERIEGRIAAIMTDVKDKEEQEASMARLLADYEAQKGSLEREIGELEADLFGKRSMLDRLQSETRTIQQDIYRLEAHQHAQDEAGGKALSAIRGMDGVHGTIAQLGRARAEYATALNVAAGSRIHYVVVENDTVAATAIRYLKDERLGRMTFLPLNKLKRPPMPPLKESGVIDYATNLLEFDSKFTDAFAVVFGATVVMHSLDQARKLMGRFRMVTVEGELLEKTGAMTGGYLKKAIKGFGTAVEDDLSRVRHHLSEILAEASLIEQGIQRVSEIITEKRRERTEIEQEISRVRMVREEVSRQAHVLAEEMTSLKDALDRMAAEIGSGSTTLADLEARIDALNGEITALTRDVEALKRSLDNTLIPVLTENIEKRRKELEDSERRLRNKDSDIMDLQRERQHFTGRLDEIKDESIRIAERNKQIDSDINHAKSQIVQYREMIRVIEDRQKQFSSELDELRKRREEISDRITQSERKILGWDVEIEGIRVQLAALGERQRGLLAEIEVLRDQTGGIDTDMDLKAVDDAIAEANHAIRRIGAVNMLAIEEYDKVRERVAERADKKEILSKERASILDRIESYEAMKFDAFMTAYRAIDANFREVFARLTSGTGTLILENEEDPFSGGLSFAVKPRDKPVHLLSALSGGEKSLTTLAFIFSIQKHIPAPFYAFDEVDMSLDGTNVERIASMIRELAAASQFIIVSLRKPMIEGSDRILGVTLLPDKSSFVTGVKSNA